MDGGADEQQAGWRDVVVKAGEWAGWTLWVGGDPFEDHCGPFYWREEDGGVRRSAFTAEHKHMNGGGFMHGGCVMTFADYCLFVIARPDLQDRSSVTATLNGEFVGTARIGDRVECVGEVVKAGRSMVFVRGLIVNATNGGDPMMSFSGVIKKTSPRG